MATDNSAPEEWLRSLKQAVEAGRYRTEAALGMQERFPWQDKTCGHCPFWLDTAWCEVNARDRSPGEHTCGYFDFHRRPSARQIIDDRMRLARERFWTWYHRHDKEGAA